MQTMPGRHSHGQKGSLARGWPWRSRQQEAIYQPCSLQLGGSSSLLEIWVVHVHVRHNSTVYLREPLWQAAAGGAAFLTPWRASVGESSVKMLKLPNHSCHLRVTESLWPCKNFQELYRRAFSFRLFINSSLLQNYMCKLVRTLSILFPQEIVIIRLTSKPTKYHNISEVSYAFIFTNCYWWNCFSWVRESKVRSSGLCF